MPHRDRSYPGAHPPIIDIEMFGAVQARLADQTQRHVERPRRSSTAWLKGLLFDARGESMSPTFTRGVKGQIYCYYISTALRVGRARGSDDGVRRVSAQKIERVVTATLRQGGARGEQVNPDLVQRVEVHQDSVHVVADRALLLGRPGDLADNLTLLMRRLPPDHRVPSEDADATRVRIINSLRLKVRGGECR